MKVKQGERKVKGIGGKIAGERRKCKRMAKNIISFNLRTILLCLPLYNKESEAWKD